MTDKKCEFCDKRGVPILPLRYAVAPAGTALPHAAGPAIALTDSAAYYTRRLLRSGYLYVFDEARKRWDDYFVTEQGLFFKLPGKPTAPVVLPQKPFNCPDLGHREVASCITIPDAKNATKVWLGFSDVVWTAAVRSRHESASYRSRHMRCVDVKAFASSPDKAHTLGIHTVASTVAEYSSDLSMLKSALGWSPFAIDPRKDKTPGLIKACENLAPSKGFAVVLEDPAGVAQELALLMKRNHDLFVNEPTRKRSVALDGNLDQLELAIKQQGERDRLMQAQQDARTISNPGAYGGGDGGASAAAGMALARAFNKKLDADLSAIEENIKNVPGPELDAAANDAWKKYAEKLNPKQRQAWRTSFETELKSFDAKFISPLAVSHSALMKHASLASYFECNFDPEDIHSGEVYVAVLGHCIVATSDKKICFDTYKDWMSGDLSDTANLLLQGLVYNNKTLRDAVTAAINGSMDWRGLSWDKVLESFDKAAAKLLDGRPDTLGRLIGYLSGPIAATMIKAAGSGKVYAGLVALGAISGQPFVRVEVTGGRKAFRTMLVRQLFRMHGSTANVHTVNRAVAEELRRLRMHGVPLEGTETKHWLLMIDPDEVKNMPKGLTPTARAQWLAKSIRTPEQVEALNLDKFRTAKVPGTLGAAVPVSFAALGVLANWVAMDSIRESEAKAMAHTKSEGLRRVYAQGAQLLGASAAAIETLVGAVPALASRASGGLFATSVKVLGVLGKWLGAGGSMVMAGIDFARAWKEIQEQNFSGAAAYGISGLLGAAATICLFFSMTGIGLILVGLMFVWAFVMPLLVDDNLQDWLERTLWGKLPNQRYKTLDEELSQLKAATS